MPASITFTDIPYEGWLHILNGFCQTFGYSATIPDPENPNATIPNPQSREEYTLATIMEYILSVAKANSVRAAIQNATTTYNALAEQTAAQLRAPVVASYVAVPDETGEG
jgi:hypothetical protein